MGTFKLPAPQRSKLCGEVRSTPWDGTVHKVCTVQFQMYSRLQGGDHETVHDCEIVKNHKSVNDHESINNQECAKSM